MALETLHAALVAASPATTTVPATHATAHSVSAWSLLTQLVIGLAVILAIIFGASRLLSGKTRLPIGPNRRKATVSVLVRQSMGKGVAVAVVRAGTNMYLLGVTQHQVTCLDQLDPECLLEPEEEVSQEVPATDRAAVIRPWRTNPGAQPAWGGLLRQLQERSVRR